MRSQTNCWRVLRNWIRDNTKLDTRFTAALAREAERSLAFTDANGAVWLHVPGFDPERIAE
jgi:hypothetical protein